MKRSDSYPQTMRAHNRDNRRVYPFAALVGQHEMKLALLLNAIDPRIGGALVMGQRGTGKSTAVRALADLLPSIAKVRGCIYGCDPQDEKSLCADCARRSQEEGKLKGERGPVPVVELPLGATEDRVCGTIDIERALKEGVKAFEAGLLARAHRGFLYIDEVNLLEDHLVDLLLDASVTGRNVVEREGISIEHPARFVLVGSGNPEEGELRPQLVDRFGLNVEVRTVEDLDERVLIVERHERFELDPEAFRASFEGEQEQLRRQLLRARKNLHEVRINRELVRRIAELCQQLRIDGHRGELTIARSARAMAAFLGRREARDEDVREVAAMALRHRLRRDPLGETASASRIEQALAQLFPTEDLDEGREKSGGSEGGGGRADGGRTDKSGRAGSSNGRRETARTGASKEASNEGSRAGGDTHDAPSTLGAQLPEASLEGSTKNQSKRNGRASQARQQPRTRRNSYDAHRGRYTRVTNTRRAHVATVIALDATLRAALRGSNDLKKRAAGKACDQSAPQPAPRSLIPFAQDALRYKRFKKRIGTLFIFAVDASGSMALNRINQAKGALIHLLERSYVRRDRVALISFREQSALVHLQPSRSIARARRVLDALPVGGATPLSAGLASSVEIAQRASTADSAQTVLLLFTDGRANVSLSSPEELDRSERRRLIELELERFGVELRKTRVTIVVVDTQNRFTSGGEAEALASLLGGRYLPLPSSGERFNELTGWAS